MTELSQAALVGVVDLLVMPEYSRDWLFELLEDYGGELTEDAAADLDEKITAALRELAQPLIERLSDDNRTRFAAFVR
jgi:hypothetical protein